MVMQKEKYYLSLSNIKRPTQQKAKTQQTHQKTQTTNTSTTTQHHYDISSILFTLRTYYYLYKPGKVYIASSFAGLHHNASSKLLQDYI